MEADTLIYFEEDPDLTDNLNSALFKMLDSVAVLKTRKRTRMKSVPWLLDVTRALKQMCRKCERRWHMPNQETLCPAGVESF